MIDKKEIVYVDESLEEIIPFFIDETFQDFAKLDNACKQNDFVTLKSLAHTLKGECGGYGFHALGELAKGLEYHAMANDMTSAIAEVSKMKNYLSNVEVVFKKVS